MFRWIAHSDTPIPHANALSTSNSPGRERVQTTALLSAALQLLAHLLRDLGRYVAPTAADGIDRGHQLLDCSGLDDETVGPTIEDRHRVMGIFVHRQDQQLDWQLQLPNGLDDSRTVELWHGVVDDENVGQE